MASETQNITYLDKKQKEDIQNQIQARLPIEQEFVLPLQIYQKDKALQHADHHAPAHGPPVRDRPATGEVADDGGGPRVRVVSQRGARGAYR